MAGVATCFVVMIVSSKVWQITYQFTDAFNNIKTACTLGAVTQGR